MVTEEERKAIIQSAADVVIRFLWKTAFLLWMGVAAVHVAFSVWRH